MHKQIYRKNGITATHRINLMKHNLAPDQIEKTAKFKQWLDLFFIGRGRYRITQKGYEQLAPRTLKETIDFAEQDSSRERSGKTTMIRRLLPTEVRNAVAAKIKQMIANGKTGELYDSGYIVRHYHVGWKKREVRIEVVRNFIRIVDKDIREIETTDFYDNFLRGLLTDFYDCSCYKALVEANFVYSIERTLKHLEAGKFRDNKLYPWELIRMPFYLWSIENIRIAAVKWLVWKVGKEIKELSKEDFENNGLNGLLAEHYRQYYQALVEAGYVYSETEARNHAKEMQFETNKIYPWEMKQAPNGFYEKSENRIAATRWLVWKLKKDPREITVDEFYNNGIRGIMDYSEFSAYESLLEAGLVTEADERYMRSNQHTR